MKNCENPYCSVEVKQTSYCCHLCEESLARGGLEVSVHTVICQNKQYEIRVKQNEDKLFHETYGDDLPF